MEKPLNYLKQHKIVASLLVIALIGGYFWYSKNHASPAQAQYVTQAAQNSTITVAVSATGQVSAENQIDLKPGSSGNLTSVNVKAGDTVRAGQTIAVVDESNNYVSLSQARASVMTAQANYDKLVAGLVGSDLAVAQNNLNAAKNAVDRANADYTTTVTDQQKAVDRANNKLLNSGIAAVPNNLLSTATVSISGSYTGTTEGSYVISLYETGNGTYYNVAGLGNTSGPLNRGFNLPLGNGLFINFSTTGTINSQATTWMVNVPDKTSSEYYSNLNAYNDALANQTQAIKQAQDNIQSANDALATAQLTFDQKVAPPDNAALASAKASLLSAQAQLQSAGNSYNNNILKSSFDGVVAALNNKTGDQVTSATVVATVITKQQLITVSLNEVDVAKVKVGQKATLTFDAIDGLELTGQVVEVNSLGTVTQGVVSYTVKIGLDTQDDRIKPSMTASADIITDVKTDVLSVPSSAVKTSGDTKYVQMLDAQGLPQNKTVEVGISNDTTTEIVSGISTGDSVVTQTINPKTSATSTTRTTTGIPGLGGGTTRTGGAAAGGGAGRFGN